MGLVLALPVAKVPIKPAWALQLLFFAALLALWFWGANFALDALGNSVQARRTPSHLRDGLPLHFILVPGVASVALGLYASALVRRQRYAPGQPSRKKSLTRMTPPTVNINDVTQAIQLALGPVFLLTGIAGILNVMTGRLARIIDRGRSLTEGGLPVEPELRACLRTELHALERRRNLASAAITASTLSALLVCMVITALFLEVMLDAPL